LSLLSFLIPCTGKDGIENIKQHIKEHELSTVVRLIIPFLMVLTAIYATTITFK
jgi:hypothetical protein